MSAQHCKLDQGNYRGQGIFQSLVKGKIHIFFLFPFFIWFHSVVDKK